MSNPFLINPGVSGVLAGLQGFQAEKDKKRQEDLQDKRFALIYGTKQQQEQDRQQAQTDRQNNYKSLDRQRRISEYLQRTQSGEFDGLSDDEIKARTGIDPKNPFGDAASPNGSGNLGASPLHPTASGNGGDMGTPPDTQPTYAPGQLGSPGSPVDALPQAPMVPPGAGLPQAPLPAPQQGFPQGPPPNALQSLPASVGGTPEPPGYSPTNKFQMPSPYTNGPAPVQPPFGSAPASGLTPTDMQTPPGAQPWQGAPSPLRTLTPTGPALTGVHKLSYPGGYDPVANAQARMQQDNDRLQQIAQTLQGGNVRSQKGRAALQDEQKSLLADRDKQNDDINAERGRQSVARNNYNDKYLNAAALKLDPNDLLNMANKELDNGIDVAAPRQYQLDRGLSEDAWKRVGNAAQDAIDADPEHWQDKTYNGKPFSFYYDAHGNRLNVPESVASQMGTAGLEKTNAQTDLATARIDNVKALTDWTKQYKGVVSQSQIDRANAAIKYLNGPKTQETQAVTDMIRQGRIPEALQQIEKLRQQNNGTFAGSGGPNKSYNEIMKQQSGIQSKITGMLRDPMGGSISPSSLSPEQKAIYDQYQQQNAELNRQLAGMRAGNGSSGNSVTPGKSVGELPFPKIDAAARAEGIDGTHYAPLLMAENSGRMFPDSSTGAMGYAQLMPGTAKSLGVNPRDKDQNLAGGARYLAQQYKRFGRWDLAYAAYNAGPGAVIKAGYKVPNIPETQAYVRKIMSMLPPDAGGGSVTPLPVNPRVANRPGWKASPSGVRYRQVSP